MVTLTSQIDELDARLIAELRENPRLGCSRSRAASASRAAPCRPGWASSSSGVITGFGPEVDPVELGHRLEAFVLLELTQGRLAEAVAALEVTPEVLEADAISGPRT